MGGGGGFTTFLQLLASLPAMQRMASGLLSPSSDFSNSCTFRNLAPLSNIFIYIVHLFEDKNISIHCIPIHVYLNFYVNVEKILTLGILLVCDTGKEL